jgi:hypothetical protein
MKQKRYSAAVLCVWSYIGRDSKNTCKKVLQLSRGGEIQKTINFDEQLHCNIDFHCFYLSNY